MVQRKRQTKSLIEYQKVFDRVKRNSCQRICKKKTKNTCKEDAKISLFIYVINRMSKNIYPRTYRRNVSKVFLEKILQETCTKYVVSNKPNVD